MISNFRKKANREFFNNDFLFKTIGIVILLFVFLMVLADIKIYQKKINLTSQISNNQKQIENIKKSNQTLQNGITNSDNVDYLEKLGYEQFNQARPGETEYIFIKPVGGTEIVLEEENFWGAKSWFNNVYQWIKNKF